MRTIILTLGLALGFLSTALAGGNSSVVEITVTSIAVEDGKITIKGDGMLRKRIMSDAEHGDATAFGQPAQMLYAKVEGGVFEVIPYHEGIGVEGVPMGPKTPEMKAKSVKWWEETLATAAKIKVGDKLQIGYQRERMTITGLRVTHITGSGGLTIKKD